MFLTTQHDPDQRGTTINDLETAHGGPEKFLKQSEATQELFETAWNGPETVMERPGIIPEEPEAVPKQPKTTPVLPGMVQEQSGTRRYM